MKAIPQVIDRKQAMERWLNGEPIVLFTMEPTSWTARKVTPQKGCNTEELFAYAVDDYHEVFGRPRFAKP